MVQKVGAPAAWGGLQLQLMGPLGLRRKDAVISSLHLAEVPAVALSATAEVNATYLGFRAVRRGTKGGSATPRCALHCKDPRWQRSQYRWLPLSGPCCRGE